MTPSTRLAKEIRLRISLLLLKERGEAPFLMRGRHERETKSRSCLSLPQNIDSKIYVLVEIKINYVVIKK